MLWPALAVFCIDQISKWVIIDHLPLYESRPVISRFFNLVHVRNRGMAFGLMNKPDLDGVFYLLILATLATVVLLLFWFIKLREENARLLIGMSLILGGAVGNLMDRIRFHEVIDFLDFYLGAYHWPAFNVADAAITVGTFWVGLSLIFQKKIYSSGREGVK